MKLHWGNAIVIFFALFLSLAGFFIVFSLRQNNDLEDEDYYERGADYSQQIEVNNRSAVYDDSISIAILENTININFCKTILKNSKEVKVNFYRPSEKEFDYYTSFKTGDSIFSIDKSNLMLGRYIAKINWTMAGQLYNFNKELIVK